MNSGGSIVGFKFVRVTVFCVVLKLFFCLFYRFICKFCFKFFVWVYVSFWL